MRMNWKRQGRIYSWHILLSRLLDGENVDNYVKLKPGYPGTCPIIKPCALEHETRVPTNLLRGYKNIIIYACFSVCSKTEVITLYSGVCVIRHNPESYRILPHEQFVN
jgi:hypothetical protein